MKKIITSLSLATLVVSQVNAQKLSISPEIGLSYNTIAHKVNAESRNTGFQFGFNIGGMLDYQFNDHFAINTGLLLRLNSGGTSEWSGNAYTGSNIPTSFSDDRTYKFHYLTLPVMFVYKTENSYNQPHMFFGIGPAFNIAIAGNYQQEYTETIHGRASVQSKNQNMEYGTNQRFDHARPFDITANAMIGFQTSRSLYFKANYGVGLFNLSPKADGSNVIRNSGVSLSVGMKLFTMKRYAWS